jgi:hypothetical protein
MLPQIEGGSMKFRYLVAVAAAITSVSDAAAQSACHASESLKGEAVSAAELFDEFSKQSVEKGEFETTAQFEARKLAIGDPPPVLVRVDVAVDRYTYDADQQAFQLFIPTLEPSTLYRSDFRLRGMKEVLGDYQNGNPVHMKLRDDDISEREYEATNAYGATTLVTEKNSEEYVVFDNKGRRQMATGDNLFEVRKKYETAHLIIPVPLDRAPEVKSQLTMVALIDPHAPLTAEADYRISPTREYPRDIRTHYKILFADIQCVGVLDGDGTLLAHWQTR